MLIRPASYDDLVILREIERAAGEQYRTFGLDQVADDEPASLAVLGTYVRDGRAWVAAEASSQAVGYILVELVDGAVHIEQVSVLPDHQGRGVGRALIEHVKKWASSNGAAALTLATFDHIPWNRPLYEHLGFGVLPEDEIGPALREIRDREAEHGLDRDLRVVMRLDLGQ